MAIPVPSNPILWMKLSHLLPSSASSLSPALTACIDTLHSATAHTSGSVVAVSICTLTKTQKATTHQRSNLPK